MKKLLSLTLALICLLACFAGCNNEQAKQVTFTVEDITVFVDDEPVDLVISYQNTQTTPLISWTYNASALTISSNKISAKKEGVYEVKGAIGSYETTFTVTVTKNIPALQIDDLYAWVGYPASDISPIVANTLQGEEIVYSNYNEEVISIQNGYVTALQVGETAVKATCGSEEVTFNVKCLPVERSTDPLYYVDEAGQGWISAARNFADQWNYYGKEGISTAFIGDSFFDYRWFFTNFYQMYQGKEAVCYGIGGTTSHTWELFIDEYFNHMQPKNIVIHVGNNNVYNDHTTEEETVIDLERFLTMLHGRMPNTHIYYFAITYRVYDDVYDSKGVIKYVNGTLNRWCEGKDWITFMDTSDDLTPETIKSDLIHPLLESYNIFKEALEEAGCEIVDKE